MTGSWRVRWERSNDYYGDIFDVLQEVTGDDDSDLYLEEREAALRKAQEDKLRVQMSVPGMVNPHELPEEMQDE